MRLTKRQNRRHSALTALVVRISVRVFVPERRMPHELACGRGCGGCGRGRSARISYSALYARKVSEDAQLSQVVADTRPSSLPRSSLLFFLTENSETREKYRVYTRRRRPMGSVFKRAAGCDGEYTTYMQSVHPAGKFPPRRANDRRVPYFSRNELRLYVRALSGNCEIFLTDHTVFYDRDFGSFRRALAVRRYL